MGTTGGKRFRRVHRGRKVRREEKGKRDGNTEITEVGTQREERRRKEKKGEERRRKEKKGEERRWVACVVEGLTPEGVRYRWDSVMGRLTV